MSKYKHEDLKSIEETYRVKYQKHLRYKRKAELLDRIIELEDKAVKEAWLEEDFQDKLYEMFDEAKELK